MRRIKPDELIVVVRKVRLWLPELSFFCNMIDNHIQCIKVSNVSLVFVLPTQMLDNISDSMLLERDLL